MEGLLSTRLPCLVFTHFNSAVQDWNGKSVFACTPAYQSKGQEPGPEPSVSALLHLTIIQCTTHRQAKRLIIESQDVQILIPLFPQFPIYSTIECVKLYYRILLSLKSIIFKKNSFIVPKLRGHPGCCLEGSSGLQLLY